MKQHISSVALVVKEYDEAIEWYTTKLNFTVLEDTKLSETKRWVMIAPPGAKECSLLLAKAAKPEQVKTIGNQTGGRVFLFLFTDDFWRDYKNMLAQNITFVRQPAEEEHGTVAVFKDLYGNLWDLIQPSTKNKALRI